MQSISSKRTQRTFSFGLLVFGLLAFCIAFFAQPLAIAAELSHADPAAQVYLIAPTNGQQVPAEFTVKFGLSGMGVAPAGTDKEGTGHHHLLIDVSDLPSLDEPLPATENIRHFGGGQTETTLSLPTGKHTLQLIVGNYTHVPHDNPVISDKISIIVK